MSERNLVLDTFQRLFTPLELKSKTIYYEFFVKTKGEVCYNIRYTKRHGYRWMGEGIEWTVSKFKEHDWTHQKMTKEERLMVIDYCRKQLGDPS